MRKSGKVDHKSRRFYKNQPTPEPEPVPIDLEEDAAEEVAEAEEVDAAFGDEIEELDDTAIVDAPPPRPGTRTRVKAVRSKTPLPATRHRGHERSAKKPRSNLYTMLGVGVAMLVVAGFGLSGPMEKRAHFKAIEAGGFAGYEAAAQIVRYGPGAIRPLVLIAERGSDSGRLTAGAGLAFLLRETSTRRETMAQIAEALDRTPSEGARMAFAAAIAQSQVEAAVELASAFADEPSAKVRLELARGLALTDFPAGARAMGALLGDPDERVAELALGTALAWARSAPWLAVTAARVAVGDGRARATAMDAAAEVLSSARGGGADDVAAILLRQESPRLRTAALTALASSASEDAEVHSAIMRVLSVRDGGQGLHRLALVAAAACGAKEAGPVALRMLTGEGDVATRAAAVRAVIALRPEGGDAAILETMDGFGGFRTLRLATLDAFRRSRPLSGRYQVDVAKRLLDVAASPDLTESGLALAALESISGVRGQAWRPEKWRDWIDRRAFEEEILEKSKIVVDALSRRYSSGAMKADEVLGHPALAAVSARLAEALAQAGPHEQEALQTVATRANGFRNALRAAAGR